MYIHEYGNPEDPVILGLHPMGITGEDLYQALAPHLEGSYFVIAPDQGGHGKSGHYTSLEEETQALKAALLEQGITEFHLLYGASMGVTVAYELLKDPAFHFQKVWFDGGGFSEKAPKGQGAIAAMMRPVLKLYRKDPNRIAKSFRKHYGPVFGKIMLRNFMQLSDEDIIRVFGAFSSRDMVRLPKETQENMHLEWGSEDGNYRQSKNALPKYFPYAQILLREGYGHCTYMAAHTAQYVRELEKFMQGN